uniref:Metalloendopeptidase n=1 Tax=Parastrongyloides trichosuri TaxID=131310 RepID=A0A0N5A6R1_PARTI
MYCITLLFIIIMSDFIFQIDSYPLERLNETHDESNSFFYLYNVLTNFDSKYYSFIDNNQIRSISKRSILVNRVTNWTTLINYHIEAGLNENKIRLVLNHISRHTCLRFQRDDKVDNNKEQLRYIKNKDQCYSTLGRNEYAKHTYVRLTTRCANSFGVIEHETCHGLGLFHEQMRFDRDNYVTFVEENVPQMYKWDVMWKENWELDSFNITYDYGSLMHYGHRLYGKTGNVIINVKNIEPYNKMLGQDVMLTFNDFKLINYYYCITNSLCLQCICPKEFEGDKCEKIKSRSSHNCPTQERIAVANKEYFISDIGTKRCMFYIKSKNEGRVHIRLTTVRTRPRELCIPNVGLEVKYLKDKGVTGLCLCGYYKNIKIISEGNDIVITYTGIDERNYFEMYYQEIGKDDYRPSIICYNNICYNVTPKFEPMKNQIKTDNLDKDKGSPIQITSNPKDNSSKNLVKDSPEKYDYYYKEKPYENISLDD